MAGYANPYSGVDNPSNPFGASWFQQVLQQYKQDPMNPTNPAGAALDTMGDLTYSNSSSQSSGMPGFNTFATQWSKFMNGNRDAFNNWLSNRYGSYWNDYNTEMAKNLSNGQPTNTTWLEWLSQRNPMNEWNAATDFQRGFRPQDFWTRTKWTR
jgi:hypothetical protein